MGNDLDLLVENYNLQEQVRKLDGENKHLKCQLKNKNSEIISLRKVIEKLKKQIQSKRKERYRNQKGDRR